MYTNKITSYLCIIISFIQGFISISISACVIFLESGASDQKQQDPVLVSLGGFLLMTNHAFNIFFYLLSGKKFRQSAKALLRVSL